MINIDISIVIITTNREEDYSHTLESLARQQLEDISAEIITVCNGTDDYYKKVKIRSKTVQTITRNMVLREKKPFLHSARHRGLIASRGKYIVFCDDDICASKTWICEVYSVFRKNQDTALVCSRVLPKFIVDPPDWLNKKWNKRNRQGIKCVEQLSIIDCGKKEKIIDPLYIFGCAFAIQKKVLLEAKGFHPDSFPSNKIMFRGDGETYVSNYAKEQRFLAIYNPKALIYHVVPSSRMTFTYFYKRSFDAGISESFQNIRNKTSNPWMLFHKFIYFLIITSKYLMTTIFNTKTNDDRLQIIIQKGHVDGYIFHQIKCITDNKLFRWVIKNNYL